MPEHVVIKPIDSFNTLINVLMGTGPILLPPTIAAAGYALSLGWLFIMLFLSSIGAQFIVEANFFIFYVKQCLSIGNALVNDKDIEQEDKPMIVMRITTPNSSFTSDQLFVSENQIFQLKQTLEYGTLGNIFWGKKGEIFNTVNIILYLYGVMITKSIIVGSTMSVVFSRYYLLESYDFWVVIFFVISGALSFKNVASIAIVQTIIAYIRYITIATMVIGASIMISEQGEQEIVVFEFKDFSNLFGTTVFAFLMHHSIPQMLRPVQPQSAISQILNFAFSFAMLVFIIVPLTGMMGFPGLSQYCYYNIVFDQQPVLWAFYIISFYMFLNISALPVLTITLRTNMMKMCVPHQLPKNSFEITRGTFLFTLLIVLPCLGLALGSPIMISNNKLLVLRKFIQSVVGITGGLCGVILMMIIPSLMVISARKMAPINPNTNPLRSFFFHNIFAWTTFIIASVFLPYNLYLQIVQIVDQVDGTSIACLQQFNSTISAYS